MEIKKSVGHSQVLLLTFTTWVLKSSEFLAPILRHHDTMGKECGLSTGISVSMFQVILLNCKADNLSAWVRSIQRCLSLSV